MKAMRMKTCLLSAMALVVSTASAALNVAVNQHSCGTDASVNGYYPVSSNDLGEAAGTTLDTTGTLVTYDASATDKNGNPFTSAANLFDGGRAYGGKYPTTRTSTEFDPDVAANNWVFDVTGCCVTPTPGAAVTVTFPPSERGYNIASIVSLSGYLSDRQVQAYTVAVLPHGSAEWADLGVVSGGTDGGVENGLHEVQLTVTGADGGLIASGADAVRFTFLNTTDYGMLQGGGVSVYREIDINGVMPAQVTVDQYTSGIGANGVNGHYPVSSTDLGEAAGTVIDTTGTLVTYDASLNDKNGNPFCSAANLFDGGRAYGGKYPTTMTSTEFDPDVAANNWVFGITGCCVTPTPGAAVTVTFPPSDRGYDIASIVSLSGYLTARQVQAYTVAFLPHGSAEWTYPLTVSGGTDVGVEDSLHEVQLTVTGAGGGLLASGADAVRFTFLNTTDYGMSQGGGVSVYREIDINVVTLMPVQVAVDQYTSGTNANGVNGYFPVSSADLGEAAGTAIASAGTISTYGGPFTDKYGNPMESATYLFDGGQAYGGKYATTESDASFDPDAAATYWAFDNTWCAITPVPSAAVTVTFPPRDGGYDIASIVSLSGWSYNRQVQAYTVAFLPHGSADWTYPATVSGGTDVTVAGGFHEVRLTVTGEGGGLLASGVEAVRFTFLNTTSFGMLESNGVSVYREIDINGKVAHPKGTLLSLH